MNHTALHDWHVAHGGRMVDFAGWEMPIQYTSIIEEHQAVRQRAGLFDIGHMGRLKFTGPDACSLLNRLLTNDVTSLGVGQVRYSLMCNESGGTLDDVLVYRFADCYRLVVNASNRVKIVDWIYQHRGHADVEMTDETLDTSMIALQGPQSLGLLQPMTDSDLRQVSYFTALETTISGLQVMVSRTGYTGEVGFEIVVDATNGPRVWKSLIASGRPAGLLPCGLGCRDTLRLEAAMPLYGHEMDESVDPLTAGLSFGVKLNAGDFIGRDALRQIHQHPLGQKRVGLGIEGRRIAREGAYVFVGDEQAGVVTSGTFSPTLERTIAMAYVSTAFATVGTRLEVDLRGQRVSAQVVDLPFYKRACV